MQHGRFLAVFAVLPQSMAAKGNPVAKTLELLTTLQGVITRDGEQERRAFEDFYAWCDDSTHQKENEIKTATRQKSKSDAAIAEATSNIEDSNTQIKEFIAGISAEEGKLKIAVELREREKGEFDSSEQELMSAVDMLNRAIEVLEHGASFIQGAANTKTLEEVMLGLSAVVDAASFVGDDDKEKLMALIQSREDADDSADDGIAAPAPAPQPAGAAYEGHGGGIVDVMQDMRDKAEAQLRKERGEEAKAVHNFEMTEATLKASIEHGKTDLETEKANLAQSTEAKATEEGEIAVTKETLAEAQKTYAKMQHDCMQKAADHDITLKGRQEELAVLAKAKKVIQASVGGAFEQTSGFLQVSSTATSRLRSRVQIQGGEVVKLVEKVASEQRSSTLEKLASKIKAIVRFGSANGEDPFVKIKQLVQDMIRKLQSEMAQELTEKEYCDSEMFKTEDQIGELQDEVGGLKARVDEMASGSALQKETVKDLQFDLVHLAEMQSGRDGVRRSSNAAYQASVADLQKGLTGIRSAIKILRDYFASDDEDSEGAASLEQTDASFTAFMQQPAAPQKHEASSGAGNSIISLLEMIESDFAKNLAEEETEEAAAQAAYDGEEIDSKVSKATKDHDMKLKTKEFKSLDKAISDSEGDLGTSSTELSAVLEYFAKLKERCVAKKETYEEAKRRREAEIKGLEEALAILEGETVSFLQRRRK